MHLLSDFGMNVSSQIFICLLLFVSLTSISHAGVKFVIETDKPHNDFVIRCQWYSNFMNWHGGSKLVKENVLISKSGYEIDCGWSLFGDGPSVDVMHPLFVSTNACAYGPECKATFSEHQKDTVIIKPISIEKYLDILELKYSADQLQGVVGRFCAAHFNDFYFRAYDQVKKINIALFEKNYGKDLKRFWKRAALIGEFEQVSADADIAIAAYMRKSK